MSEPLTYPRRQPYFAHRLTRLLTKCCAAQELGPEGMLLVIVIAHLEDAKRYTGPVTFWNHQLMPICGFASEGRLIRTRERVSQAGWIHYEPGGKYQPGKYWALIPATLQELTDSACDESPFSTSKMEGQELPDFQNGRADESRIETEWKPNGSPSTLSLTLNTSSPNGDGVRSSKKPKRDYSEAFSQWWEIYPRKVAKEKACKAFPKAITAIAKQQVNSTEDALTWLLRVTSTFAASPKGQGEYCPYGANWLNGKRFNDDPAEWQERKAKCSSPAAPEYREIQPRRRPAK